MTNKERLVRTINRQPVDRLLTWDFIDNEKILSQYGGYDSSRKYSFEELTELNLRAFREIGLDITRFIYDPVDHWMGNKVDNWIRFFGVDSREWEVSKKGGTSWISKRPFKTISELEKNMPKMPDFEEVRDWFEPLITYIGQVFDGNDIVFIGGVEGPMSDSYTYMDMELFSMAIYDAPEIVAHVMDCTAAFSEYMARIYAENATAPILFMGEDICCVSGPIFSPEFLRREALPRWRKIREPISQKGYAFIYHTDGLYGNALPLILEEFGADALHPIERNGLNDIFEIRKRYPDTMLMGNVCCAVTLPTGTPADVEDETLEIIERLGPEGNIVIGSSSEVHGLVPPENACTMYRTVYEYGTYPIDIDRIRSRRVELKPHLKTRLRVG
ncbi:MAG: hypothetical protein HOC20_05080 [Chloroflexi bacterium]|jgi:uroporphyrinogen-III decarboxylase|nr:hypothetical protein [Chloroflexota bacterium]